ncbi:4-alpha-glucanotransferase [Corynebacterium alimapuense]|uniref:4-alpha-glucanotransferase n=1 Tax=Corynebacterium alimapuense TaxID=1576874 RepID=A0A3M8KAL9_9CORY|nr:4-alpha-glucanotransferase [Corynebacterium alimapuense]RNE49594.1 4-alpha-glucanotransferase [Corynebacterium alimapuense]
MTYQDVLRDLADAHGVATQYTASDGELIGVSQDTLIKTLRALGVQLGDDPDEAAAAAQLAAYRDAEATRPLPPCVVTTVGSSPTFNVHVHDGAPAQVRLILEDGSIREAYQEENWSAPLTVAGITWGEATFRLPDDLPLGWHHIELVSGEYRNECALIITPVRLSTTDEYTNSPAAGVMAQMYSVRSADSWGIGDFHDMGQLAEVLATEAGADFLLVNPMHAAEPFPPVEDSPYLPTTRRFTNPIYLRIEDVPEVELLDKDTRADVEELAEELREMNLSGEIIDRNPVFQAKLDVLHELYALPRSAKREQDLQAFVEREGQGLVDFASWCAQRELDQIHTQRAHAIRPSIEELTGFYIWLQLLCDEQLAAAQKRAKDAGMKIGIMADLAVGVHPGGADAHNLAPWLAPEASVGAPPDGYNQQGQDWSQPPWHPVKLAEDGYRAWRNLLTTVLRHSGGIRVDHILGLFRLFWIPRMQSPTTGTYVQFDHEALVGILALEAERAGAVVIGEDLGTFEPWVRDVLASKGVMGTSILWFEATPDGPLPQDQYRVLSLSSINTHDLPPTAGYLAGEHITLRDELGVLTRSAADEDAEDLEWQAKILDSIRETGCFEGTELAHTEFEGLARDKRGEIGELIVSLHQFISGTPSALSCTSLVDMVGDIRSQNQPGTTRDQYPNWCIPLSDGKGRPVLIEDLADNELFQEVAKASRRPQ